MEHVVSIQDVLRGMLQARVDIKGRMEVAKELKCSPTNLDYLLKGVRPRKKGGKGPSLVSFHHMVKLALIDGDTLAQMMLKIQIATAATEMERRAQLKQQAEMISAARSGKNLRRE